MSAKDPYATLGVPRSAEPEEIRNAYRALAKKHHPDLNPGSQASEAKFKEISHAYELIGDPESRAKYDRGESEVPPPDPAGGSGRYGPFYTRTQSSSDGRGGRYADSFAGGFDEDLFAGFGFAAEPEEEVYRMEIDLRDTVRGAEKEITLPTGKRLRVKIPPGVGTGSRLRFAGQGGPGRRSGQPVDVYVELQVRPDPRFEIEGNDLITRLRVPIPDAFFGGEVRSPTLDGEVLLQIPPRSNTGARLKLRGKGLFVKGTKTRGDEIVVVELVFPEPVEPEFAAAMKLLHAKGKPSPHGSH